MSEPWRRARSAWLAVIALAIAALVGGGLLAPATAALRGRSWGADPY
ncbi:hypothetical protein [Streptomyces sp. NPDC059134]